MHKACNEAAANMPPIGVYATLAALALVAAPFSVSVAVIRPYIFDTGLFVVGPLVAAVMAIPAALWGRNRQSVSLIPLCLIVTAAALSGVRPALDGDVAAVGKGAAMVVVAGLVPAMLCKGFGRRRSVYLVFTATVAFGGVLLAGSVLAPGLLYVPARETYRPEKVGWFINPNTLGALALSVLASLYALREDEPWEWLRRASVRVIGWAIGAIAVIGLIRSESRGAIVTAGVLWVVGSIWRAGRGQRGWGKAAVLVCGTAVIVCGIGVVLGMEGLQESDLERLARKHEDGSISGGRLELWAAVLAEWWNDAPLLGRGLTGATALAAQIGASGIHNAYLKVLIDFGVLGAIPILWLLGLTVRSIHRRVREGERVRGLAVAMIALGVHSLVENHLFAIATTTSSVIFWQVATALLETKGREDDKSPQCSAYVGLRRR